MVRSRVLPRPVGSRLVGSAQNLVVRVAAESDGPHDAAVCAPANLESRSLLLGACRSPSPSAERVSAQGRESLCSGHDVPRGSCALVEPIRRRSSRAARCSDPARPVVLLDTDGATGSRGVTSSLTGADWSAERRWAGSVPVLAVEPGVAGTPLSAGSRPSSSARGTRASNATSSRPCSTTADCSSQRPVRTTEKVMPLSAVSAAPRRTAVAWSRTCRDPREPVGMPVSWRLRRNRSRSMSGLKPGAPVQVTSSDVVWGVDVRPARLRTCRRPCPFSSESLRRAESTVSRIQRKRSESLCMSAAPGCRYPRAATGSEEDGAPAGEG